jgi:hypothetical protein
MSASIHRPRWRRLRRLLGKVTFATVGSLAATSSAAVVADPPDQAPPDDDAVPAPLARTAHGTRLAATAHDLAIRLESMGPLAATHAACTWALAPAAAQRLAVAEALTWVFPLVGDSLILDHLSRDPGAAVRAATARAAWARRAAGGDPGVLARLAHDPDDDVAEVARLALRDR